MNESLATINVGVVDNGFDTSHEDLNITVLNNEVNSVEHHGTHVAGIIGATNNNETGITGILDKVQLYGVDCYATSKQKRSNIAVSSLLAGIELCISNNCKVVNMSSGTAPTNAKETRINAENSARETIKYLIFMLDSKDTKGDFIITQSAGNGDKNKNGIDAKQYGGYFSSIDEEMVKEVFDSFDKNNIQLEHNISVQDVLDSYLVVGAVDKKKKNGTWQLANFSNYGKTITVCAPGVDVFSTTVMGGLNGNYANDSGTSMAAPIVAGITAMVWSTNLDMSSGTVKNIIQQTADIAVSSRRKADNGSYYMINAAKAVEFEIKAFAKTDAGNRDLYFPDSVKWTLAQIQKLNPHGEYLFMNNGKRIRENTFNKRLSSICDILKIDHRSTHKIRKTYGTTLLDNNVDDSIVSEQMGHSDIATTRKLYYFCNKSEKTKIAQINNAINF